MLHLLKKRNQKKNMADVVLYEKRGHVAIFTLNRPKAMNAVSGEVSQMMEMYLEENNMFLLMMTEVLIY